MPNSYFLVGWPGLVGQLPGLAGCPGLVGLLPGLAGCPGFPGCPGFIAIETHLLSLSVDLAVILGVQINLALWLP